MSFRRLTTDARRAMIIQQAMTMAREHHFMLIQRAHLAERCGISKALINHYFTGGMEKVQDAVVGQALIENDEVIISQAKQMNHDLTKG